MISVFFLKRVIGGASLCMYIHLWWRPCFTFPPPRRVTFEKSGAEPTKSNQKGLARSKWFWLLFPKEK